MNRLSGNAADIVQEEEEKESDEASQKKDGSDKHSGDDMASVGEEQKACTNSDQSETSIRRMEGSFTKLEMSS